MKKLFILCFFTLAFGFICTSSGVAAEVKEMTIVCEDHYTLCGF